MSKYIRRQISGGAYFFTARLQDPSSDLLVRRIDVLRMATRLCLKRWPFVIEAAVVLPNKVHMIWTLPSGDREYPKRWRLIKSTFSRHVPAPEFIAPSQQKRGEKGIWQRRYWEHLIRDQRDMDLHMHLITTAPVTAGLASRPTDWPYSSLYCRGAGSTRSSLRTIAPVPSGQDPEVAASSM